MPENERSRPKAASDSRASESTRRDGRIGLRLDTWVDGLLWQLVSSFGGIAERYRANESWDGRLDEWELYYSETHEVLLQFERDYLRLRAGGLIAAREHVLESALRPWPIEPVTRSEATA